MRYILNLRHLGLLVFLLCSACGTALPSVKPFKLDVQQGNVVTSKMLLQLRPGMTKSQVRFIMGSPLIQDSFHGNRWDYAYQLRENGKLKEQRRVILDFENDVLKAVRGDVVPAGSDAAKALNDEISLTSKKEEEEKSLLDQLKFWNKDEAQPTGATDAAAGESSLAPSAPAPSKNVQKQVVAPDALIPGNANSVAPGDGVSPPPNGDALTVNPASAGEPPSDGLIRDNATVIAPETDNNPSILAVPLAMPMAPESVPAADDGLEPLDELNSNATPAAPANLTPSNSAPVSKVPEAVDMKRPAESAPASSMDNRTIDLQEEFDRGIAPSSDMSESEESAPNLVFDRALKMTPLEAAEAEKLRLESSREKTPPSTQDLPPETDPGFFDRMLQRIGF